MSDVYDATDFECAYPRRVILPNDWEIPDSVTGQCDCGGGACVSAPLAKSASEYNRSSRELVRLRSVVQVAVEADYSVLHSPFARGPIVVHQAMLPMLHRLEIPILASQLHSMFGEYPRWYTDDFLKALSQLGFIAAASSDSPDNLVERDTALVAWLHVTDRCNLRCDYCYLSHDSGSMTLETGKQAVAATINSALMHGFRLVRLKYAGGEPTLCFSLLEELHRCALNAAEASGLELEGVVLTNGTLLTSAVIEALQKLRLRLMISLDGLGEFHDRQRRFADGQGSFSTVAGAIEQALSQGLIPDISITVTERNIDGLPGLVAWVLERELPFCLNFYRPNHFSVGHPDLLLQEEAIIEAMLSAYRVIEHNMPRRSLLASLVDRADLSAAHLRTCGVGRNYLVFDPMGRVAKCQMDMQQVVSSYNERDLLSVVQNSPVGVSNPSVHQKLICSSCQWRYWCTGGCPLTTFRVAHRYDVKSPSCNIYKALFPEAIRLEGLRILKYRDHAQLYVRGSYSS